MTERVWKGGRGGGGRRDRGGGGGGRRDRGGGGGGEEGQRRNQDERGWSKEACWKKRQEIQELNSVHFIS